MLTVKKSPNPGWSTDAEAPYRGNITQRLFQVIVELNAEMGAAYGQGMKIREANRYQTGVVNQRMHRNAESGRPFAPAADNGFPLTLIHPNRQIGQYNFRSAVIDNCADMRRYFEGLHNNGYQVPRNHSWNISALW
ncbi:hypothetical protein FKG94_08655 [Exilibacterium tricleocarpae]|uniref:Uncharacterized protein n=1 Tax=Exilibacterium tricleocarpae TaxID=2591008 RepID=A0A545TVC5_9GAMM|nr:hypothetical protein [Exilibacterium tricleocarpae]TQV81168.1 hypothetical protein FKG94_08655 [Exilibacterium tricleocarpae]